MWNNLWQFLISLLFGSTIQIAAVIALEILTVTLGIVGIFKHWGIKVWIPAFIVTPAFLLLVYVTLSIVGGCFLPWSGLPCGFG
jgi:hypothetical protein